MAASLLFTLLLSCLACCVLSQEIYNFTFKDIDGNEQKMDKYKGYVLLVVNVASACGKTGVMYPMLQKMYDDYKDKGLRILGFPCNQWLEEPGTDAVIKEFTKTLGITFDLASKIDVNGPTEHKIYTYMKKAIPRPAPLPSVVEWNFGMFLFGRTGKPCAPRFTPVDTPLTITSKVEKLLEETA